MPTFAYSDTAMCMLLNRLQLRRYYLQLLTTNPAHAAAQHIISVHIATAACTVAILLCIALLFALGVAVTIAVPAVPAVRAADIAVSNAVTAAIPTHTRAAAPFNPADTCIHITSSEKVLQYHSYMRSSFATTAVLFWLSNYRSLLSIIYYK